MGDWQRPSFDLATQAVGVVDGGPARRLRRGLERPVRGRDVVPPAWRGRGIGTWLAPGPRPRRGGRAGRWSVCRCPSAALATGCSSGSATTWPGRPGCSSCPRARRSSRSRCRRAMRSGSSRRARSGTRYQVVEDAFNEWPNRDAVDVRRLGGRVVLRPGFEPWNLRVVARPGRRRRRGRVRVPQPGLRLRPVPRGAPRPARPGSRAGPARRLLRGGPGARRVTLRAVHRLPHRCARPLRARRYAGHVDLGPPRHRALTVQALRRSPSAPRLCAAKPARIQGHAPDRAGPRAAKCGAGEKLRGVISRRRRPCWRCRRACGTWRGPRAGTWARRREPLRARRASSSADTSRPASPPPRRG